MDYTVLVLERAAEARRRGSGAREAAREAIAATGPTISSAALIMVVFFAVFATLPLLDFKELGIGLAVAIAIDATIVRGIALPAALTLLGDRGIRPRRRGRRLRGSGGPAKRPYAAAEPLGGPCEHAPDAGIVEIGHGG
jgi:uncharacterized membrane protein YdfJ with MMPL/SSD domain